MEFDMEFNRKKQWNWLDNDQKCHVPPFQSLKLCLNEYFSVKVFNYDKICLNFCAENKVYKFETGSKIKVIFKILK